MIRRTLSYLSSHQTSSKLTARKEQFQVVASHVILGHTHNRAGQAHLAVVIRAVLAHISRQLRNLRRTRLYSAISCLEIEITKNLNFILQLSLKATEQNLTLRRLEPVHDFVHRKV